MDVSRNGYAWLHAASAKLAFGNLAIKRRESEFLDRVCNIPFRLSLPSGSYLKNEDVLNGVTDRITRIISPGSTLKKQMRFFEPVEFHLQLADLTVENPLTRGVRPAVPGRAYLQTTSLRVTTGWAWSGNLQWTGLLHAEASLRCRPTLATFAPHIGEVGME